MKKILLILIALIGFGIGANAQTPYVSGVDVYPNQGRYGDQVRIIVTVRGHKDDFKVCNQAVKVFPVTRNIFDALFVKVEYGTVVYSGKNGVGTVEFWCSMEQNAVASRCGAYDFKVEVTNNGCI